MRNSALRILSILILTAAISILTACSAKELSSNSFPIVQNSANSGEKRQSVLQVLMPQQTAAVVYGNDFVSIDASNTDEGYIMVLYKGSSPKVKLQITIPNGTVYTYNVTKTNYETFPLTGGNGLYNIKVLENARDNLYSLAFTQDFQVAIKDEFKPFLYPNQYVWFTETSKAVELGKKLSDESYGDLSFVQNVYHYVTKNITYDDDLAANIYTGYLPDLDLAVNTGKGICFDYASLMAAILRSQSVPTKLEIGYSGEAYHAWVSVYIKEVGWVDKIIQFDGKSWSLMDPTLAANNSNSAVGKYIGDGSNYTVKYSY